MPCSEICLRTMQPTEGSSKLLKMGHGGQALSAWLTASGYAQGAASLVAKSSPFRHRSLDLCLASPAELIQRFPSRAIISPRVTTTGSLSEDPATIEGAPEAWRKADVRSDAKASSRAMQCVACPAPPSLLPPHPYSD
jgi:hypothetical protein